MGWMTHKPKGFFDWAMIGLLLGAGMCLTAFQWFKERVVRGNIHWNESHYEQELRRTSGQICTCRKCRNS